MLDTANHTRVVVPVALRALEAQRLVNLIAFKANPALAAGLIAYAHIGEVGSALLVAAAMLGALQLVERSTLPLGLMPAARLGLGLCAPVLGAAAAAALALAAGHELTFADLQAPVAGAWLIMALGAWVTTRFDDDRRARVAVIGSRGLRLRSRRGARGGRYPRLRGDRLVRARGARTGHARRAHRPPRLPRRAWTTFAGLSWSGRSSCSSAGVRTRSTPTTAPTRIGDPYALIADSCLDLPVRMLDANQLYEDLLGHVPLGTTDSAWFRYIMHPRFRPTSPLWKRCFDLANAAWMAVFVLPLVGIAGVAIKLADGGPVFYRQRRVGERGKEFEIVKLRTMVPDAEAERPAVVRARRRARDPPRQVPAPDSHRRAATALECRCEAR